MEGREREAPKLLLNQGPSEPCYATATTVSTSLDYSDIDTSVRKTVSVSVRFANRTKNQVY